MTIDINVTLFVREQRVIASPPSPIDNTNVVILSGQERVVAWVRGDNRYQCQLVCMRKCYCVPFITNRYQCHIVVRLPNIANPQSPLDTGIPKSLPNPIPIMGMIQIQINRTRSTFTYKYLCNIPVYRYHYDGHDLNSNQLYTGTYVYMQKYLCCVYRYPYDGHDLNSNQSCTYVYIQKFLCNILVLVQ